MNHVVHLIQSEQSHPRRQLAGRLLPRAPLYVAARDSTKGGPCDSRKSPLSRRPACRLALADQLPGQVYRLPVSYLSHPFSALAVVLTPFGAPFARCREKRTRTLARWMSLLLFKESRTNRQPGGTTIIDGFGTDFILKLIDPSLIVPSKFSHVLTLSSKIKCEYVPTTSLKTFLYNIYFRTSSNIQTASVLINNWF